MELLLNRRGVFMKNTDYELLIGQGTFADKRIWTISLASRNEDICMEHADTVEPA